MSLFVFCGCLSFVVCCCLLLFVAVCGCLWLLVVVCCLFFCFAVDKSTDFCFCFSFSYLFCFMVSPTHRMRPFVSFFRRNPTNDRNIESRHYIMALVERMKDMQLATNMQQER